MAEWQLPGQSSVKKRLYSHKDRIKFNWSIGKVSCDWPISVEIHPTNRCNLSCLYCAYRHVRYDEGLQELAFEHLIDELIACRPTIRSVLFSGGGEPTLHRYLPEAVRRLHRSGADVGIITNGVVLNRDILDAYMQCTWIRFSVDTCQEATYSRLKSGGNRSVLPKVLEHIKTVVKAKAGSRYTLPTVGVSFIVTQESQDVGALMACLDLSSDLGVDYVMFRPLSEMDEEQITVPVSQMESLESAITDRARELNVVQQYHKFLEVYNKMYTEQLSNPTKECPIVQEGLVTLVAANGEVMPCYMLYQGGYGHAVTFGNITEQPFREIWLGERRFRAIADLDARMCPYCRFVGHNRILNEMRQSEVAASVDPAGDKHWTFL
ncbi:MAG: radical SAM protein [Thermoleophilia bacterium]